MGGFGVAEVAQRLSLVQFRGVGFSILAPCYSLRGGVRNLRVHLPSNWCIFVFLLFIGAITVTYNLKRF